MAADYWASTQHLQWERTAAVHTELLRQLDQQLDEALVRQYPLPTTQLLNIFFQQQLSKLCRRLTVRQHVLATAHVYLHRFYSKVPVRETNPVMVLVTAFYLAGKIEENPHHIRAVVNEARALWPELVHSDPSRLGECEFRLISELNAQLVVYHPYRGLERLQETMTLTSDEMTLAWSIINDHYATDLPLLCSPHVIATAAVVLALTVKQKSNATHNLVGEAPTGLSSTASLLSTKGISESLIQWVDADGQHGKIVQMMHLLAQYSPREVEAVVSCTQHLLALYSSWDNYSEKTCKEQLTRLIKGRGFDE